MTEAKGRKLVGEMTVGVGVLLSLISAAIGATTSIFAAQLSTNDRIAEARTELNDKISNVDLKASLNTQAITQYDKRMELLEKKMDRLLETQGVNPASIKADPKP